MLRNTFIHLPRISYKTERKVWASGILTWYDFLKKSHSWDVLKPLIVDSITNLKTGNYRFFKYLLGKRDWWRVYPEFKTRTLFLDIETDPTWITLIGIYNGKSYYTFIRGINLASAVPILKTAALLVTYNGTRFDLPILRAELNLKLDSFHLDLLYILRRLGLSGSLKRIEKRVGINRPKDIRKLTGADAISLWYEYKKGNKQALQLLKKYNQADTVNLERLLDLAYKRLRNLTFLQKSGAAEI